jgi:hypothetical protein
MRISGPPIFKTTIRPLEAALLILYLEQASRREKSQYLAGLLDYVAQLVLYDKLAQNMSATQISYAFEHAEAVLADIQKHGEPWFWIPPEIEEENEA